MAFDPMFHEISTSGPLAGFVIDRATGHPLGLTSPVALPIEYADYPKWVVAHQSHVVGNLAPEWPVSHKARGSDDVQVLVETAEEEARAVAAREGGDLRNPPEPMKAVPVAIVNDAPSVAIANDAPHPGDFDA